MNAADQVRVQAILTATAPCQTLPDWLARVLEAVDDLLGFPHSSLLLVLAGPPRSIHRAFAGAERGGDAGVLADYFDRWADSDPLAGEHAHAMFDAQGFVSTTALYPELEPARQRFVDQFLASIGVADQLSVRLPGNGTTDGYLTVHEQAPISESRRETLVALAPGLARQLRSFLPRGLPGAVSTRERQTAELVALGFGNRQIAATLNVGTETVKKHVYRAITRLGLERRTQLAVSWATGRKLVLPAVQSSEHRQNV
jgi:DNA-binding CsgD family transcriptional regulator